MKIEVKHREEDVENEEVTIWEINKGDGAIVITINKLFEEGVLDCCWLDNKQKYLEVMHGSWCGSELFAIVNNHGEIVKKSLVCIKDYVARHDLFIVQISNIGLDDDDLWQYEMINDDCKMAVLNRFGEYVIGPIYNTIEFDLDEKKFYASNSYKEQDQFTIYGDQII